MFTNMSGESNKGDEERATPNPIRHYVGHHEGLEWYARPRDHFVYARTREDVSRIAALVHALPDGCYIPIRGRDFEWADSGALGMESEGGRRAPMRVGEWDYGTAVKCQSRLYFLYDSGDIESFLIDGINFHELVHFVRADLPRPLDGEQCLSTAAAAEPLLPCACTCTSAEHEEHAWDNTSAPSASASASCSASSASSLSRLSALRLSASCDPAGVLLINHGWSDVVGPDYPLIRTLEHAATNRGWHVIVPDFRESYRYGRGRGRSERVKMIYEELLCCPWVMTGRRADASHSRAASSAADSSTGSSTDSSLSLLPVVLVGHSQGGAASALACTDRIVEACNIQGLMLLGSESPLSLDGMAWTPRVPHLRIVHARGDGVITLQEMSVVAQRWERAQLTVLESAVRPGSVDCYKDDIHHDFVSKDLMRGAVDNVCALLDLVRELQ
eukprot:TRINITY_DN25392_c0_g1_i1.p1 TRINITY_DN25392_c0_g1~~TRINITY_DN25392_c0_g1_i1.p1  ORF type:complete len:445 (-),score=107.56 TRINITY_DN25392_c0_g1_i1:76-1410(-)